MSSSLEIEGQKGKEDTLLAEHQYLSEINEIISKLVRGHFYGQLLLSFESGLITTVKKTESMKLANHNQSWKNRDKNHEHFSR